MRREDIANFLTAERHISPLTAFSLLIVAGFLAGSMQLVAPIHDGRQQFAAAESTSLQSKAPTNCTEAITAAFGQQKGPQVTTVDQGKSGTADSCFGGVVKDGKTPSSKITDYDCVGRSGKVTITSDSAISVTIPDKAVPLGQCKVQVCQPFATTDASGKQVTNPNCGEPKQFSAGQNVTPQSGGVPQVPPIGASTPSGSDAVPKPNGSEGIPPIQPTDDTKVPPPPPGPNAADQIKNLSDCSNTPECGLGDVPPGPTKPGAVVPNGTAETLQPFPTTQQAPISGLNAPGSGYDPNVQFQPNAQQQTTFPNTPTIDTNTFPTQPQGRGLADTNASSWTSSAAPVNTYGQPGVTLPTLQDSTMTPWQTDAMANPGRYGNETAPANWNDVPTTPSVPAQDLDNGINTPITCDTTGCTAKPTTPADVQALQRDGFTCANGSCARTSADLSSPGACPGSPGCPGNPGPQAPAPYPGSGGGGGGGTLPSPSSGSGGLSRGLSSLLSGFMKGLASGLAQQASQQPAQQCPRDPQAYAQYQQQYNQQLQQYNYQMQQYNYQLQVNSSYGYASAPPPPPAPQPCTPNNGSGQCPQLTAQPSASSCPTGTWRQMPTTQSGSVVCPVWQCVSGTAPTAQITCSPDVAETSTPITISYSCTNAQRSTGYGFDTNGAVSGAATTTLVNAPANAASANYAIKCENGQVSSGAQCTVQIAKVSILLRAQPNPTPIGTSALIGWVTTGMKSCVVSSPDQQDFTNRNTGSTKTSGIATTSPITQKSVFYLSCITQTGGTKQESVTVDPYRAGTVSASIENRADVMRGSTATLRWNFADAPDVSAVALWLYSVEEQKTVALISGHRAKSGTYEWDIPYADDPCNTSSSQVCGSDLIPGRSYAIIATLYTPPNANLGELSNSTLPAPTFIDRPMTQSFKVAQ